MIEATNDVRRPATIRIHATRPEWRDKLSEANLFRSHHAPAPLVVCFRTSRRP